MKRWVRLPALLVLMGIVPSLPAASRTFRLHDGVMAFVPNAEGKDFTIKLDVRDLNLFETGPREVLVKVYDPDGKNVVRAVIPDDGVTSRAFLPPAGAWDHEAWYYAYVRLHGAQPMIRWSAFSSPDRLAALARRTFTYPIKGGKKGVYRIQIVGFPDHYVTLTLDPDLAYGVAGHPTWLHGHGDSFKKSMLHVPRGTKGLILMLAEYDLPVTRSFTLTDPKGNKLFDGPAANGFLVKRFDFEKSGLFDDQLFTLDVSAGAGDFLMNVKFMRERDKEVIHRGEPSVPAVFASDAATAKAVQGGAIYHDDRVFWQPFQVRFHDWLKKQPPEAFIVKDRTGKTLELKQGKGDWHFAGLPTLPDFLNVNERYAPAPVCDGIMHHYPAHKNPQALNVALRDLAAGLRSVGPVEVPALSHGPWANMAYEFGNYAWQYWRPAWRILKQSDAPEEAKQIVNEAFLLCGDRLAFCVTWARTNGNAFAQLVAALRYCQEATGDPMHKQLFDTYWQRFTTGGWGDRAGISRSGHCQEGFGHDHHYGSYILGTWKAINHDLKDQRFQKVYDRIRNLYSYTMSEEVAACPWSSREHHQAVWSYEKDGPFAWKGFAGPDFTVSVNDGNEWFAARRKNYYMLTYHGRITPPWIGLAFSGQIGYSGGTLCQLHVPGRGPVLASTLNGHYGENMHPAEWPSFHLHSVVGKTSDGKVLVAANSEHDDAKLTGNKLTSSGPIRDSTVEAARSYTFNDGDIECTVTLKETGFNDVLNLWIPDKKRGLVAECYEMIPFLANKKGGKKKAATDVIVLDAAGKEIGPLTKDPAEAKTIVIDRGGFGVRIELDQPRKVHRGQRDTVLIHMINAPTPASKISLGYRMVPFAAGP